MLDKEPLIFDTEVEIIMMHIRCRIKETLLRNTSQEFAVYNFDEIKGEWGYVPHVVKMITDEGIKIENIQNTHSFKIYLDKLRANYLAAFKEVQARIDTKIG